MDTLVEEYYSKYQILLEGRDPEEFKKHVAVQAQIEIGFERFLEEKNYQAIVCLLYTSTCTEPFQPISVLADLGTSGHRDSAFFLVRETGRCEKSGCFRCVAGDLGSGADRDPGDRLCERYL